MAFNSLTFLFVFLPLALALHWVAPRIGLKNGLLLAASLVFYAWGEGVYLGVLLVSIVVNHGAGLAIANARDETRRLRWLGLGVAANLVWLGGFKYLGFATGELSGLGVPQITAHLPLGISFFTFQAISYLVDVHRRDAPASPSILKTGLFIALFPQLIAGPIVRFKDIERQIEARRVSAAGFVAGVQLFVVGLAQKTLIADTLARPADAAFTASNPDAAFAWLGLAAYTLQIFFDFAGYSNMAIGLGRMFGFRLPQNFSHPYAATSVRAFWRRWHITLSAWFRDYLYIPLGGGRGADWKVARNLFIVFVLCGFWHGAAWTFVIWGLWHGAFLALERTGFGRLLARVPAPAGLLYTLAVVSLGWVVFRVDSIAAAGGYFASLAGAHSSDPGAWHPYVTGEVVLAFAAGLVCAAPAPARWVRALAPWRGPLRVWRARLPAPVSAVLGWSGLAGLAWLSLLVVAGRDYAPFIYFRF